MWPGGRCFFQAPGPHRMSERRLFRAVIEEPLPRFRDLLELSAEGKKAMESFGYERMCLGGGVDVRCKTSVGAQGHDLGRLTKISISWCPSSQDTSHQNKIRSNPKLEDLQKSFRVCSSVFVFGPSSRRPRPRTAVQRRSFGPILGGGELLARAKTGSGKTWLGQSARALRRRARWV